MHRRRRKERTQTSILNFTQKTTPPAASAPATTAQASTSASASALPKLPRPTAPPFFRASPRPHKRPRSTASPADDAWHIAEQLMNGDDVRRNPVSVEEHGSVVPDSAVGSDSDFESDGARKRVAEERNSAHKRSVASALKDDRRSMTKRSANRSTRSRAPVVLSTQKVSDVVEVSDCEGADGGRSRKVSTDGGDGEKDKRILFEGNKSEMSGTEDEGDDACDDDNFTDQSPIRRAAKKARRVSLPISLVTPGHVAQAGNASNDKDVEDCLVTPEEYSLHNVAMRSRTSAVKAPRKRVPPRNLHRRQYSSLGTVPSGADAVVGTNTGKGARDITSLFQSDSEEDVGERSKCQSLQRSKRTSAQQGSSSSSDDVGPDGFPKTSLAGKAVKRRRISQGQDLDCTPSASQVPKPEGTSSDIIEIKDSEDEILPQSPQTDLQQGTGRPRTRSQKPLLSPQMTLSPESSKPSTPSLQSPPSTKRRRIRSRLVSRTSEEDAVRKTLTFRAPERPVAPKPSDSAKASKQVKADTPVEWFHERNIDEFSSSSNDFGTPSKGPGSVPTRRVTRQLSVVRAEDTDDNVLPVRRDILKSFSDDVDEHSCDPVHSSGNTPTQSPRPVDPYPQRSDFAIDADDEGSIVDLVDDDNERFENVKVSIEPLHRASEGQGVSPVAVSGAEDAAVDVDFDDDAPPPFNLLILCDKGESISQMMDRLGEEYVMEKVTEAQNNGREIIGGEALGLTKPLCNKKDFSRFKSTVVADQIGRARAMKSVTEQALRGEYKFNYRGRDAEGKSFRGRGGKKVKGSASRPQRGRLSGLRRKRT